MNNAPEDPRKAIDKWAENFREDLGGHRFEPFSDLPLTHEQKKIVLEHIAVLFWRILNDNGYSDGHCKSYDPLVIEEGEDYHEAHSYVFDMKDGGRHHSYEDLQELEDMIVKDFEIWIGEPDYEL